MNEPTKPGAATMMEVKGEFAEDLVAVFNLTHVEGATPRVLAIVTAAYIENYLTDLIREKLPGLNPTLTKSIFNDKTGPLGTIGNKIDMAEALEVITKKLADDARLLARIRNRFAHELRVDTFDHVRVRDLVDKLKGGSEGVRRMNDDGVLEPIGADWTRDHRFKIAAIGTCVQIMQGHIKEFPFVHQTDAISVGPEGPSRHISVTQVRNPKSTPGPEDQ